MQALESISTRSLNHPGGVVNIIPHTPPQVKKYQEERTMDDRWGDQVFESTNSSPNIPNQGWNGYSRQKGCNPGVFVYWVELEFLNGKKYILKGDVTLCK